jgi:hypothetical protein
MGQQRFTAILTFLLLFTVQGNEQILTVLENGPAPIKNPLRAVAKSSEI